MNTSLTISGDIYGRHTTGRDIDELVMAVLDAAGDREDSPRDATMTALIKLGNKEPMLVLVSCVRQLSKQDKLHREHRIAVLIVMTELIKNSSPFPSPEVLAACIAAATTELTASKDIIPEWQNPASNVLVAAGVHDCPAVMNSILDVFKVGQLPHYFIIHTVANLAAENKFGFVQFLQQVLNNLLPNLGPLRHDNMRYVCAYALGKFAEALIDYLANLDRAPDSSIDKADYLQSFNTAFDILALWLANSKEVKLRAALMESLGYVSLLTSREKVESHLQVIVTSHLLPAVKRQNEFTYPATQCLAMLIDSCNQNGSIVIGTLADAIMSAMLVQMNEIADFSNPIALKTHNEMFRCFTLLCLCDSAIVVNFLLSKLEPKASTDAKVKARVLSVLRQLVNTADNEIGERRATVLISLREVVNDMDEGICRALLQLIVSMADHGYFELEGSRILIEYVVRQCALTQPKGVKTKQDFQAIANLAASVLNLLTTTLPQVESALWPHLLEYLLPAKYSQAFGHICKSLAFIGQRRIDGKTNGEDHGQNGTVANGNGNGNGVSDDPIVVNFATLPNVPKPIEIFARCLLMAADETELNSIGTHVIKFMDVFAPNFFGGSKNVSGEWQSAIDRCTSLIEADPSERSKDFAKEWEASLLKVLLEAIEMSDNQDYISDICQAMFNQLELYKSYPRSRCLFHLLVAGCISRSVKRDFITKTVDDWFGSIDHSNVEEQQAFGFGCGFAATTQLDAILGKVESGLKGQPLGPSVQSSTSASSSGKSSSAFLNFFKDLTKSDSSPNDRIKSTLFLCMGNAVSAAPPSLAVSRVETIVVPHLLSAANGSSKAAADAVIRLSIILCIDTVAKSLHPDVAGRIVSIAKRDDLLSAVRKFVGDEAATNINSEVRLSGIKSAMALAELDPILPEQLLDQLVSTLIQSVFQLPESASSEVKFLHTMDALGEFLLTIFNKFQPMPGLAFLMKHLADDKWLQSTTEAHRERSLLVISKIMKAFQEKTISGAFVSSVADNQNCFTIMAQVFAVLIPRLADPGAGVRLSGSSALVSALRALVHMTGKEIDVTEAGRVIQDRVNSGETNALHSAILDLAKVLCKLLSDIKPLVTVLNLSDSQSHGSAASCLILHTIIKQRSNELVDMIPALFDMFLTELSKIIDTPPAKSSGKGGHSNSVSEAAGSAGSQSHPVQTGILRCCRLLAQLQLTPTLSALLAIQYPYPESVSCMWRYLAQDNQLAGTILDAFLDKLSRCIPYEEPRKKTIQASPSPGSQNGVSKARSFRVANIQPLLILAALGDMFTVSDMEGKLLANYHHILATLILLVSAYAGAKEPSPPTDPPKTKTKAAPIKFPTPVSQVLLALNNFLNSAASTDVRQAVDDVWPDFAKDDSVLEAVAKLAGEIGKSRPKQMSKVAHVLLPHFTSPYDTYRSAVASCLAEFIKQASSQDEMVETLIATVQGHLTDQCFDVRLYCYRGMGNVGIKDEELVNRHATSLLNCLLMGLEDREDSDGDISLESLKALSNVLGACSETVVRPIFVNIVVRVKLCFDNENGEIRAASIKLFGELTRFAGGPSEVTVWEQAHLALVPIWVHLNDPDSEVSLAAANTLVSISNVLGAAAVIQLFQKALGPVCQQKSTRSLHFVEFSSSAAATLAEYFADRMFSYYTQFSTGYFSSPKSQIRANAVTILGYLLANLPADKHNSVGKHHLCTQLMTMLKDSSAEVRCRAAEAIGLLAHY